MKLSNIIAIGLVTFSVGTSVSAKDLDPGKFATLCAGITYGAWERTKDNTWALASSGFDQQAKRSIERGEMTVKFSEELLIKSIMLMKEETLAKTTVDMAKICFQFAEDQGWIRD